MDSKILTGIVTGLMLLFFTSCEKDANIDVPEEEPRLVVYSYITPGDSLIQVSVTSSNSVFGNEDPGNNLFTTVENATVTITTNGSSYNLAFDLALNRYIITTSTLGVNPGQYYELAVSAPGFETVSASTTVPNVRDWQFNMSYHGMTPYNEQLGTAAEYRFNVSWKHYDNNDYYRLAQHFYLVDTLGTFVDTLIEEHNNDYYTKQQASGGLITDQVETSSSIYSETPSIPFGFYYDLIISTYDYYKFHESLNNYSSGDPFAEPTLVYSNMKNGYGIFAGYLKVSRRVDF